MMKRNTFFKLAFAFSALILIRFNGHAQVQMPQPSPFCSESRVVAFTEIKVEYSSPGVKGRTIWGDLVPYDTPWRAGANAATTVNFSTGVKIGGTDVNAGTYSVYITPKKEGNWVVHFNRTGKQIYSYISDGKVDMEALGKDLAANVEVAPVAVDLQERLQYDIKQAADGKAHLIFSWEKISLPIEIDTAPESVLETMEKRVEMSIK